MNNVRKLYYAPFLYPQDCHVSLNVIVKNIHQMIAKTTLEVSHLISVLDQSHWCSNVLQKPHCASWLQFCPHCPKYRIWTHCPKYNLNVYTKTEPVTVGADATEYWDARIMFTKAGRASIPLHPLPPWQAQLLCGDSAHFCDNGQLMLRCAY